MVVEDDLPECEDWLPLLLEDEPVVPEIFFPFQPDDGSASLYDHLPVNDENKLSPLSRHYLKKIMNFMQPYHR